MPELPDVVVYLEADTRSWPAWRSAHGYERANPRIVSIVEQVRTAIGNPTKLSVTLTGHSGGGSFAWGFIDGQDSLPPWLDRIGFLDSNYSFEPRHGDRLTLVGPEGLSVAAAAGLIWHYSKDLPDYSQLQDYEPPVMTRVYGGDGRLFGSITSADVSEAIFEAREIRIDRRHITVDPPIRATGTYVVPVDLGDAGVAEVKTIVSPLIDG